jgi:hypothetical protein
MRINTADLVQAVKVGDRVHLRAHFEDSYVDILESLSPIDQAIVERSNFPMSDHFGFWLAKANRFYSSDELGGLETHGLPVFGEVEAREIEVGVPR